MQRPGLLLPPASQSWVSTFYDALKKRLAQEFGRLDAYELWMDPKIQGNQAVTPAIQQKLAEAQAFICILSKGYLESEWCREELNIFHKRASMSKDDIFVVKLEPSIELAEISDLYAYKFWEGDEKEYRRVADPMLDSHNYEVYYKQMRRLVRNLAECVERPRQRLRKKGRQQPQSANDKTATIFLSGGARDRDLVHKTAEALKTSGLQYMLPLNFIDQEADPASVSKDRRDNLETCSASLVVYDKGPLFEVRQFLNDCHKSTARRDRPLKIFSCYPDNSAGLGLTHPNLTQFITKNCCAEECVEQVRKVLNP